MIELVLAIAFDLLFGEPPNRVHPVVWFGKITAKIDRAYKRRNPLTDFLAGIVCTTVVLFFALVLSFIPRFLPFPFNLIAEVYLLKSSFAIKSLYQHVKATICEDVEEMRRAVSLIVSRDVSKLDRHHLISASIESLAENIVDSVISPIFYYMLFGLSGALIYRAINTLDAMIGYRNEKYEYFGKFSARLDDILNFIPARITVLLFLPLKPKRVWQYCRLAKFKINSDKPIACMSAVLSVWIEKEGVYRFEGRNPRLEDVKKALKVYCLIVAIFLSLVFMLEFILVNHA
ncbi:adenosylcobinamide-phosphate synthase CbiB [Archaeoglobus profundus]|uniref:Probable cobalamin biosynthesis protein CobD n=1 Tax=Archaeoglobus profundus (strain DSM 5631 / JCM 9629 / NBRC 100127 / Av18) TaxID=572546 RepID=D2RGE7_ARCPA|nr:adenosylcobinamide-phosphate synthase CbiB [Archaeoglobus profundus]ADB57372.1 cobalamin biosynthesis protein CobD [Archaeoglobus profundus DSM 5631]